MYNQESYAKIEEEDEADSYQANAAGNTDGNNIFENFFGSNPVEEGHSQNKQVCVMCEVHCLT